MTQAEIDKYRSYARKALEDAGIAITPEEVENIEVADLGLGEFQHTGLCLLTFLDTDKVGGRELILLPHQTVPQHLHPVQPDGSGKEETFRCRTGEVYIYAEGADVEPVDPANAKATPPKGREHTYTVWKEVVLRPGEQYVNQPGNWHWLQAGPEGCVVTEISTRLRDHLDKFSDPSIGGR